MLSEQNQVKISVVDDHRLFRNGLVNLIQQLDPSFEVISEAGNGREFLDSLATGRIPDVLMLDMNMPVVDGFDTTTILREKEYTIGIIALTILADELNLIKLLKAGVDGYLSKDIEPDELRDAIISVANRGSYYSEFVAGKLVNIIRHPENGFGEAKFNEHEMLFIEHCCSDDTYQMIADKMNLSVKTIDGYRARLFEKLNVKSRVGLVLYALKNNLISLGSI